MIRISILQPLTILFRAVQLAVESICCFECFAT